LTIQFSGNFRKFTNWWILHHRRYFSAIWHHQCLPYSLENNVATAVFQF